MAIIGDHPRACGEHAVNDEHQDTIEGSSPRMRGTRIPFDTIHANAGIIPAHAGNTAILKSCRLGIRDHPRACGEHQVRDTMYGTTQGSSPRMRGTPNIRPLAGKGDGIIPAHAGNTRIAFRYQILFGDHPRACGEHGLLACTVGVGQGSSPRMRGTRSKTVSSSRRTGIIPAHAGNTKVFSMKARSAWDHPRACGEHFTRTKNQLEQAGSSPRMRGTLSMWMIARFSSGIIPAHAGNTV